jgi:prepilin-type N-terminal cleavage/methylation domain-containing protein
MTPGAPPRLTFVRGFSLTELAVVLVIVALLIGGMLLPLASQDELRRTQDTQKLLKEAQEALTGFAAAYGRLPCPAMAASNGLESFAAGGSASDGNCSNFYDGFLPATSLGLAPANQNGLLVDAWNQPIRYAVYSGTINGIVNPFTRANGMRSATVPELAKDTVPLLSVCATATGIAAGDCGSAIALTQKAPVVVFSIGKNGATGGIGADEAANGDNDPVFVSHDPAPANAGNGEFDDLVVWLSPNILFHRMIAGGQLP